MNRQEILLITKHSMPTFILAMFLSSPLSFAAESYESAGHIEAIEEMPVDKDSEAKELLVVDDYPTAMAVQPSQVPDVELAPGQIYTMRGVEITRVAIGDPKVIDITVLSTSELMIRAKSVGTTALLIWDDKGQNQTTIKVIDPRPDIVYKELVEMLEQFSFPEVEVKRQGKRIFLVGEVDDDAQAKDLDQLSATFDGYVINLAKSKDLKKKDVVESEEPLVSISVQLIDITQLDLKKLGVKWDSAINFTEEAMDASSFSDHLLKIGQTVSRDTFAWAVDALVQSNRGRILSEPKLVTTSGKQASSFVGIDVPVIESTSSGTGSGTVSANISFRSTGVLLDITPFVHKNSPENRITTIVNAEISDIDRASGITINTGSGATTVPGFKIRRISTEVTTSSGETIVIAGLLEKEDSDISSEVPGLGRIPVLGRLFRSPEKQTDHRELVIAITPEIIGNKKKTADKRIALERALAVAEVTSSVENPRFRYALQIQDRIAKSLRYPQREKELNIDGTVKLRLHLFSDGTLGRALVIEPSGIEALDYEALKVAETQAPYPGFPSQMSEKELWLDVPVIFRP